MSVDVSPVNYIFILILILHVNITELGLSYKSMIVVWQQCGLQVKINVIWITHWWTVGENIKELSFFFL